MPEGTGSKNKQEAYGQVGVFDAAKTFAMSEGIIPAPESAHAIKAVIEEAAKCKEAREPKVIFFNLSGHGLLDLGAYGRLFRRAAQGLHVPGGNGGHLPQPGAGGGMEASWEELGKAGKYKGKTEETRSTMISNDPPHCRERVVFIYNILRGIFEWGSETGFYLTPTLMTVMVSPAVFTPKP
ncbi:MAG: hypothetical protein HYY09_06245 [Firmicutes bacterium]|nr:hypothetical protein [Bacillota bacterium]